MDWKDGVFETFMKKRAYIFYIFSLVRVVTALLRFLCKRNLLIMHILTFEIDKRIQIFNVKS